jgi:hypothetical protein
VSDTHETDAVPRRGRTESQPSSRTPTASRGPGRRDRPSTPTAGADEVVTETVIVDAEGDIVDVVDI